MMTSPMSRSKRRSLAMGEGMDGSGPDDRAVLESLRMTNMALEERNKSYPPLSQSDPYPLPIPAPYSFRSSIFSVFPRRNLFAVTAGQCSRGRHSSQSRWRGTADRAGVDAPNAGGIGATAGWRRR